MRKSFVVQILLSSFVFCFCSLSFAGKIEYTFQEGPTVAPDEATLAGTPADWTLEPNRDYVDVTISAMDFSGGYLHFLDDESISNNVGLMTPENAALREQYRLSGPGDRLWIVCDYQMHVYGQRANLSAGSVDQTRGQLFHVTFQNSVGKGFGLSYVAGNYNTEGNIYFTAIGDGSQNQNTYRSEGFLIEEGDAPNLGRRTVILRITESPFSDYVIVDAKFDDGPYRRISSNFEGGISNYPAGNGEGDENVLLAVGNYSGSGAIEFDMHRLTFTDENPAPDSTGGDDPLAVRTFTPTSIIPGGSLTVQLQLFNPAPVAQAVTVIESATNAGYTISDISNGGTLQNGQITWDLSLEPGITNLTYRITAPSDPAAPPYFYGSVNGSSPAGETMASLQRNRTPKVTTWNPPASGWNYIYDPDLGSPENIVLDGWAHNNNSDEYSFQPVLPEGSQNAGEVWKNVSFISDEDFGGQALRIYDPGNPTTMPEYMTVDPGSSRKITLNFNLGTVTKAVAAFRVRTREFVDQFGVAIPFGYPDADQYPLLGLTLNREATDWNAWDNLSASGLFFDPTWPDTLNFPYSDVVSGPRIPGYSQFDWDHTVWHEYWITWNVTEGEKSTALYVDGELQPKFSYPLQPGDDYYEDTDEFHDAQARGAFFNRTREADNDIPVGNAVFRITFRNTGDAGNLEFDYIALAADTDEPPTQFTRVSDWSLF
jgi:hypothetical protein